MKEFETWEPSLRPLGSAPVFDQQKLKAQKEEGWDGGQWRRLSGGVGEMSLLP